MDGRRASAARRRQRAARRDGDPGRASTSASSRRAPPRSSCCSSTTCEAARAVARHPARARDAPHLPLLARARARARSRPGLRLPRARAVRAGARPAVRPAEGAPRPYGLAVAVPRGLRPRGGAARPGDNCAVAMKSVVADAGGVRLGGRRPLRTPFARTVIYEMHVRRLHAAPELRRAGRQARHLRRPHREDPVPAGPRRHGRRAAAGVPVRPAGRAARTDQLLGLPAGVASSRRTRRTARARTRSACSTSSATWSRRCTAPGIEVILDVVFNHTTEGDHDGPTLCYRGLANDVLLHPRSPTSRATRTSPAAATRSTPTSRSCAA